MRPNTQRVVSVLALLALLGLAALLRLHNVALTPGWFSDEGTHLSIAAHLLRGRDQYLALREASLLVARWPLFDWLLAAAWSLVGGQPERGLAVLRALTGGLGVLTTLLLYLAARRMGGARGPALGWLAALSYAVFPQAVVYSRLGFSYNLIAPLLLAALWALWAYWRSGAWRWLALAALAVGAAALTDLWAWMLLVPLAVGAAWGGRLRLRALAAGLVLAGLPFALYAAVLRARAPQAFVFDLAFNLFRLSARTLPEQAALLAGNLAALAAQAGWLALGAVGLFRLRPARLRRLALLFFWLPLLLVGRTAPLTSLSFYYLIPLLPLAALGLAALALEAVTGLARLSERWLRPWLGAAAAGLGARAASLVVAGLLLAQAAPLAGATRGGFATAIDPFLLQPDDVRRAAAFVNARTAPGDLVIASPGVAWLLAADAADFQMTIAYDGVATPHLPADLPRARFAFDPRLSRARYVIVDNLWRNWAVFHVPGLEALLAEVEGWPVVFAAGEVVVYARAGG